MEKQREKRTSEEEKVENPLCSTCLSEWEKDWVPKDDFNHISLTLSAARVCLCLLLLSFNLCRISTILGPYIAFVPSPNPTKPSPLLLSLCHCQCQPSRTSSLPVVSTQPCLPNHKNLHLAAACVNCIARASSSFPKSPILGKHVLHVFSFLKVRCGALPSLDLLE